MITKDETTKTIKFNKGFDRNIVLSWRDTPGRYKYNEETEKYNVDNIEFEQGFANDLSYDTFIFDTVEDMNSIYDKMVAFKETVLNEKREEIKQRKLTFKNGEKFNIQFTKLLLCIRKGKEWFRVRDLSVLYGAWRGDFDTSYWSIDLSTKLKCMIKIGTMERRKIDGHSYEYKITEKGNKVAKKFMRRYNIEGFKYWRKQKN